MDIIKELTQINYWVVFTGLITIVIAFKFIVTLVDWVIERFAPETKRARQKREDHELLIATAKNLDALQKKHNEDEKTFRTDLSNYMKESREDRKALHDEMTKFTTNRINDRAQSLEIQKELKDSIKTLAEGHQNRDKQIESLMVGSKELLGSTIDQLYSKYVELDGIPESEVDEFTDIFNAYKQLNGNHRRDAKYDYVINNLKVIPVKTKLISDIK